MKANELRLGNLILSHGLVCEVEKIELDGIIAQFKHTYIEMDYTRGLEGIPLTEEWLVKFGFEYYYDNQYSSTQDYLIIEKTTDGYIKLSDGYYHDGVPIKYVHQLQNLYFALTGKELNYSVNP